MYSPWARLPLGVPLPILDSVVAAPEPAVRTTREELIREYRGRGWWSDLRITDLFDQAVGSAPAQLAVLDPPNRASLVDGAALRLSFTELADLVDGYALRLHQLGLGRDDMLITQLPNIVEYPALYLAALRLGIVVSPVPMQYRRHELEQIVDLTGARAALTVRTLKGAEHAAGLVQLGADRGVQVLCLGADAPPGSTPFTPAPLSDETRAALQAHVAGLGISADDIATVCWTSGTEGLPKGVPRSHNHWIAISYAHLRGAGIRHGERLLNPFPLINMAAIGGCFMSWLHSAGTLVLHHPLDLAVYLRQIVEERPQYAIAPPALLNMLLKDEKLLAGVDLSCLRCIGSGSAPLDPEMIRGFQQRFGIEVVNVFGSNEGVSLLSNAANAADPVQRARLFPRYGRAEIEWSPPAPAQIQTRIVDPDTAAEILVTGQPGEMQIRGPTVFDGYFRAPAITAQSFTADGWFRTGDLFELAGDDDPPRFYRFVGRLKQIIVRGGVKIAPEELDTALSQMPEVLEGAVAAYPDPIMGERICAFVVPRPGATPTLDSVRAHFEGQGFAIFKHPERLEFLEQLPRNSVGKVLRADLARLAAAAVAGGRN
jgi:acyl-CoA synthetase (AMP-forming)/AMP-acid ligase II